MALTFGQWGKKPNSEDTGEIGVGPDYTAPKPNPLPWKMGRIRSLDYMPVPEQWNTYNNGRDFRPPDVERMRRSRREEKYNYQDPGPVAREDRKVVRPDTSYYDPPRNPRSQLRTPAGMSFSRQEFHQGFASRLTGNMMSMASAMRAYDIYGMNPTAERRINTLRAEPAPMDINTYDSGGQVLPPWGVHESHNAEDYPRSFRL